MSKRALVNLALLALVGVLVVLAVYQPGIEPADQKRPAITGLTPAKVSQIRVERGDKPTMVFARENGAWQMLEPLRVPANSVRLGSLLRLAEAESTASYPAGSLDLAAIGLDKPALGVRLGDQEILFGGTQPLNQQRYVRIGDTVHLIADTLFYELNGPYTDFISLALLPPGADPIEIRLPAFTFSKDQGRWAVVPEQQGISADAVQALVDAWRRAQALSVTLLEDTQTDSEITVRLAGQDTPLRFGVLESDPEFVLARPDLGLQYHLSAASYRELTSLEPPSAGPKAAP